MRMEVRGCVSLFPLNLAPAIFKKRGVIKRRAIVVHWAAQVRSEKLTIAPAEMFIIADQETIGTRGGGNGLAGVALSLWLKKTGKR